MCSIIPYIQKIMRCFFFCAAHMHAMCTSTKLHLRLSTNIMFQILRVYAEYLGLTLIPFKDYQSTVGYFLKTWDGSLFNIVVSNFFFPKMRLTWQHLYCIPELSEEADELSSASKYLQVLYHSQYLLDCNLSVSMLVLSPISASWSYFYSHVELAKF